MSKTVFESVRGKKTWKFHQILFPTALFMLFLIIPQGIDWGGTQLIQRYMWGWDKCHSLITIDKSIPILSWMVIPYTLSISFWIVVPAALILVYGWKRYAKFCSIIVFVYFTSFIIKIAYPVSTEEIMRFGIEQLTDKTDFFSRAILNNILKPGYLGAAFPSDHCINVLLITFAVIDFNFFTREKRNLCKSLPNSLNMSLRIFLTTITVGFSTLVIISTFVIKIHYFVDWTLSLFICLFWYLLLSFVPKMNFLRRPLYSLFVNLPTAWGYITKENPYYKEATWAFEYKTPKNIYSYPKNKFVKHYVLVDIITTFFCVAIGLLYLFNTIISSTDTFRDLSF